MQAAVIESPVSIDLHVDITSKQAVLYCRGEIAGGESSRLFKSAILELLNHHPSVIVDLAEIVYMDREGLEVLVSLYSAARMAHSSLKFRNLTIEVRDRRGHRTAHDQTHASYDLKLVSQHHH